MNASKLLLGIVVMWVATSCALPPSAADADATSSDLSVTPVAGSGAVCPGVGAVVCANGGHWDAKLCRCVPKCVENVACIQGDHWDAVQCKCVPNACVSSEDGPCGGFTQNPCTCATGLTCVPNAIPDVPGTCEPDRCCPAGWDMYACKEENGAAGYNCHNPQLACASSEVCGGGCDFEVTSRCPVCDPIVCPKGETFDRTLCKCVASGCATAADCSGPLPQLCQICQDGSAACAHWTCDAGQCQVATCP